ncbi:MAG: ATP-binding cassette domain-containing protein [Spirobacillus cienkowskii]|jgi:oligopeptide transport system ATP-binding protein|uniref:ATP-binding cassette domain-containing protein n=1 Tax=Spirobacillus cienkowskii TaxID=495820 RepID=A0A369KQT9_9BACT|nr:MAG: ATP-binding cassette domain-containing protein [Spirobacillus cienkowskii]
MTLLNVTNLTISFNTPDGYIKAVNQLNLKLNPGEALGIVGESGSGKTQLVLGIMGLLASNSNVSGSVKFHNTELIGLSQKALNKIRGNKISIVFQDPMTALNPYLKISTQMIEVLKYHKNMNYKEAKNEALKMLDLVKISDAKNRIDMYPHEFSGGMRQRVLIAMSLLCKPDILIADEPTTALDVTVQAQIVNLLKELKQELGSAIIIITHDLGVVAGICNQVMVMYAGNIMERGSVNHIFYTPKHPYTKALLRSIPNLKSENYDNLPTITGHPPNLLQLPKGCSFADRCEFVMDVCKNHMPPLNNISEQIQNTCFLELSK